MLVFEPTWLSHIRLALDRRLWGGAILSLCSQSNQLLTERQGITINKCAATTGQDRQTTIRGQNNRGWRIIRRKKAMMGWNKRPRTGQKDESQQERTIMKDTVQGQDGPIRPRQGQKMTQRKDRTGPSDQDRKEDKDEILVRTKWRRTTRTRSTKTK